MFLNNSEEPSHVFVSVPTLSASIKKGQGFLPGLSDCLIVQLNLEKHPESEHQLVMFREFAVFSYSAPSLEEK